MRESDERQKDFERSSKMCKSSRMPRRETGRAPDDRQYEDENDLGIRTAGQKALANALVLYTQCR